MSFVIRRLSQIIALAALYYLTARLGFLMALPPGNVTALWPPSGLALAAVMIWGWPSGLGVLIGSLIVNWESMSGAAALPVAAAIASGSTLQAWGAAWLIRRFNKVFPPATVRNTVLTIGLISLATLLAPAVGVTSLCLANYTQWDNSITLATTWWMGDLIGILIFAPGLILLALRWRKQPVQEVFLWPLTCLIFGLALFTFLFFKTNQQQQLSAQVQNDGNKMARVIQQTIDREIEALIAIRAFYNASIEVTAEEFTAFTTPLLADSPADPATAAGFEWIPRVTQVERASYEQAIRAGGYADFSIYEKGGQKENVPAAEREEYFPVTWINPFAPNQAAFGFDLASNPARLETIVLARDTGQPAATAPLQLVQDTANQTSVLIMAPVYRAGAPGETLEERRANLIGMSLGVYRVNLLLKRALEHTNRHDLEVYLYDIVNEDSPQFLGFYPSISGPQELPEAGAPAPAALRNGLYQNATITVGGRAWLVLIRPGPAYISSSEDWFAWIVLLIGLLAASAFLAYVNTRQKSEAVLARSEARYRLISENTGDVIWILDLESQRFVYVSHSVEKLRGYPPEEVLNQSLADALTPASLEKAERLLPQRLEDFQQSRRSVTYTDEIEQKRKDGSSVITEISTVFVLDEASKVQVIGITRDITERKQAAALQEAVYHIAQAAQAAESLQELYPQIHRQIANVMSAENFSIVLYDEHTDLMRFVYAVNEQDEWLQEPIPPGQGLTAHVLRSGKSLLFADEINSLGIQRLGSPAKIWLGAPLIVHGKTIGVMSVQHYRDANAYTEREQRMLEYVSSQVATVIDRQLANEMLQKSQARLEAAQDIAGLGSWEIDLQTNIGDWSKEMFRLFRYNPEQGVPGLREFLKLVHPEDRSRLLQAQQQARETGHPASVEFRSNPERGEGRDFQATLYVVKNAQGQATHISGAVLDITAIKTAQRQLEALNRDLEQRVEERAAEVRHNEAIYRSLFESSHDGIFLITPEGHGLSANQRALDMLGYTLEEYLELTRSDRNVVVAPEQREEGNSRFKALLRGENVPLYERTFIGKDNRQVDVEINLSVVRDEQGKIILVQSVVRDIAERKKAEAALRQSRDQLSAANAALEKASRMKDEFLASMSHELRTPLTGILGLSEALQLQTYGALNAKQLKAIKNIENSGRHLLELINDILDLSKIEAGKLEMQFETCAASEICQASLQLIKGMAGQRKQSVGFRMTPVAIALRADARRLKQMLVNLLSNAVKFTPEGGQLGLEVWVEANEQRVFFSVWDEGIGIALENLPQLFKPFSQLDSSLARQYSGTGLGLSLVRRMAEMHGGSITVESVLGQGSRFTISLPWSEEAPDDETALADLPSAARPLAPAPSEQDGSAVVLMADDNELILETVSSFLRTYGVQVTATRSGYELLARAPEVHPNVILVDIQMPGMDGLEVIRRLRAHSDPAVASAVILAMTALAMTGDREKCLQAGANEYMSKPISLTQLLERVRQLSKERS